MSSWEFHFEPISLTTASIPSKYCFSTLSIMLTEVFGTFFFFTVLISVPSLSNIQNYFLLNSFKYYQGKFLILSTKIAIYFLSLSPLMFCSSLIYVLIWICDFFSIYDSNKCDLLNSAYEHILMSAVFNSSGNWMQFNSLL